MPDMKLETAIGGIVCGIDEAGRGPLCGPVVAAAVIIRGTDIAEINDSKALKPAKREELYKRITETCLFGIGEASVQEIDAINILNATKLAMLRAYEAMAVECNMALIDGNQLPKLPCPMQYVIKGDSVSTSIAAASIIAKVTRDRLLDQIAEEFPHYGWAQNKGYGTAAHMEAIEKYGICQHHRTSFAPIRAKLGA